MNTTHVAETDRPAIAALAESNSPAGAAGRMLVVVPDVAEAAPLAGRIHQVAHARRQDVLIIGVTSQYLSEAELRRKLTLLAAFLQEAGTKTQVRVERGLDWIPSFASTLGENDLLACCVDESLPAAGDRWIDLLANRSRRSVHAFMDLSGPHLPKRDLPARLAPWLGSIVIILGFFWLQVQLSQRGEGDAYSGWLMMSVPVEIGLVWLLNALLG